MTTLHLPSLLLGGALVAGLAVSGGAIAAQDACPASATCYDGHPLEFNATDGPVQFLVVETTVETTTDLDGQTTSETAVLVEFASDGDRYAQRGDPLPAYPKTGVLATADVGDTFGIIELGGGQ